MAHIWNSKADTGRPTRRVVLIGDSSRRGSGFGVPTRQFPQFLVCEWGVGRLGKS